MKRFCCFLIIGVIFLIPVNAYAAERGNLDCDEKFNSRSYPVYRGAIREWSVLEATCQTEFGVSASTFEIANWYNQELARRGLCVNQVNVFPASDGSQNDYVFSVKSGGDYSFGVYVSPNALGDPELSGTSQIWISHSDERPVDSSCIDNKAGRPFPQTEPGTPPDQIPVPTGWTDTPSLNPFDQIWAGIMGAFWGSPIGQGITWIDQWL